MTCTFSLAIPLRAQAGHAVTVATATTAAIRAMSRTVDLFVLRRHLVVVIGIPCQ
jgi:hypothetical protein